MTTLNHRLAAGAAVLGLAIASSAHAALLHCVIPGGERSANAIEATLPVLDFDIDLSLGAPPRLRLLPPNDFLVWKLMAQRLAVAPWNGGALRMAGYVLRAPAILAIDTASGDAALELRAPRTDSGMAVWKGRCGLVE